MLSGRELQKECSGHFIGDVLVQGESMHLMTMDAQTASAAQLFVTCRTLHTTKQDWAPASFWYHRCAVCTVI